MITAVINRSKGWLDPYREAWDLVGLLSSQARRTCPQQGDGHAVSGSGRRDVLALWLAACDPWTPWLVWIVAGLVAAYALSPIDLIPDFIPVIGYLDDIVIVPLGIRLAVALMPTDLMNEHRCEAERRVGQPSSSTAAIAIAIVWIAVLGIMACRYFASAGEMTEGYALSIK